MSVNNLKTTALALVFLLPPLSAQAGLQIVDNLPASLSQTRPPLKIVPKEEKKLPVWIIKPQSSLRAVIAEFAKTAGWIDEWNFKDEQTQEEKDLILGAGMRITGDFKTAITSIFKALPLEARICADLRPDNEPPTVLIMRSALGGGCQ